LIRPLRPLTFLAFFVSLAATSGCNRSDSPIPSAIPGENVLLITLDTTRADRIGCYGHKAAKTPALDAIAARGLLFDNAIAQVPLTLPSHCALMTGRQPREFGIRVNNQAALGDAHPTLAFIFKQRGYQTAAFVASFVLDSRFGLDRGFDLYDDEMSNASIRTRKLDWVRPANVVADRAIAWLDAHKKDPFFCWVHFFDPHDPYTPPNPFPRTYDGEIAFMDSQIHRLDDWLTRSGLREKTLLIITGDHGESFGEHGEEGHGIFLYQTAIRVPMFVYHPRLTPRPARVAQVISVVDLFPTILDLMDLSRPEGLLSVSFAGAMQTGKFPPGEAYSESEYVWRSYGWAQQRSLINANWKFMSSAIPELYDLKIDPHEKNNVCAKRTEICNDLSKKLLERYAEMVPTLPGIVAPSAAATAALASLGYMGGGRKTVDEFITQGASDPKEKLYVVKKFRNANGLWQERRYEQAIELFRACANEVPQSPEIQSALGVALVNTRQFEEGIVVLDAAAKLDPTHQPALYSSGDAYFQLNRFDKALQYFTLATENDPNDAAAQFMLGKTLVALRQPDEAFQRFQKTVEILPDFPAAHFELGVLRAGARDHEQAIHHFQQTVRWEPENDRAHYNLGLLQRAVGRMPDAVESFRGAVRIKPQHGQAWIDLGLAQFQIGRTGEAKESLRRAAAIPETAVDAYYHLSIVAARENDAAASAQYLNKVIELAPRHPTAAWDVAREHLKSDDIKAAITVLHAAEKADPSNVNVLNLLASILATASDDSARNGQEALRVAKNAAVLTNSRNPMVLKTLAEAYAETGDFQTAVSSVQQALDLAAAQASEELRRDLTAALTEYEAGRPVRRTQFVNP